MNALQMGTGQTMRHGAVMPLVTVANALHSQIHEIIKLLNHFQCTPWKSRSCCTHNVSRKVHTGSLYGFDWNHCSVVKNMSPKCQRHFIQDLCFYECEPNVGPWVVKVG